jgi:hypothetical protein
MAEEKDTDGSEVQSLIVPQFVRDDVVVPTLASVPASPTPVGWLRKTIRIFGPGPVTGAADDDPSGIATYSSVGAQFGYGILWTMPLIYPFMAAIQEISARTWGQNLLHHPHLHCVVAGGGLSADGSQWRRARSRFTRTCFVMSSLDIPPASP